MALLDPLDQHSLDVRISELLVATADNFDPDLDRRITDVLKMLRKQLRMDVVFVSEFTDGQRVFRFMDGGEPWACRRVTRRLWSRSYCQRVVEGRMPELVTDAAPLVASGDLPETGIAVGAHLSTPVVLSDGRVYGTVCCFSAAAQPDLHAGALACLRQCARLVARKVDAEQSPEFAPTQPGWSLTQPLPFDGKS